LKKSLVSVIFISLILAACSPKTEDAISEQSPPPVITLPPEETYIPATSPPATAAPTSTPVPTKSPYINIMTGESLDSAEAAARRPIAVVINNIAKALPQSGIGQASLYYEVLAEANITRIIAVFQDFNAEKIGPVRSARDYFFDFAYDNDAIFAHHGASPAAYGFIRGGKIDDMDGQALEGITFWRDPERSKIAGMYVHSSYTSAERLFSQIKKYGYRENKGEDFSGMFSFYESPKELTDSQKAENISVTFLNGAEASFEYDAQTGIYKKFQNGSAHIDAETGEQLSVTNVIIQNAEMYTIKGDEAGRRSVELVGSGDGYLATKGGYVQIKWAKSSHTAPTVWTFADGTPLTMNVGKTWICVVSPDVTPVFE
jgi:hypothetical protein